MVKITNLNDKPKRLRGRSGITTLWLPGETVDVKDEGLLELLRGSKTMVEQKDVGTKDVGAGLKTGVRRPKSNSKAPRAKPKKEVKAKSKSKAKPKKGLKSNKGKAD
tara:strand:- start:61 stop:381 length:321 start_codon:yes stop_codon:yes gene_type:complete